MPLPSNYITTEQVQEARKSKIKSGYWGASDIPKNGATELIICGEPDDHMVGGYVYWIDDGTGKGVPLYSRTEPSEEEWLSKTKVSRFAPEGTTKENVLRDLEAAKNFQQKKEALDKLDSVSRFLAFAAYLPERDDFVVVCLTQASILNPLERALGMEEDYTNITPGGLYNFRAMINKQITDSGTKKEKTNYSVDVRVHRAKEADEVKAISARWEETKGSIYLPRYFMEHGNNNVFEGKPDGAVMPPGLPVTAKDSYGADTELASF